MGSFLETYIDPYRQSDFRRIKSIRKEIISEILSSLHAILKEILAFENFKFLGGKTPCIICKIWSFKPRSIKNHLTYQAQIYSESYSYHVLSVFRTDISVA